MNMGEVRRRGQKDAAAAAAAAAPAADNTSKSNASSDAEEIDRKRTQKAGLDQKLQLPGVEHLVPLPLVLIVLICSGTMWVLSFRDVMATGRSILGPMDDAMLHFTKSVDFFDDSKGWKSKQGGLSAIAAVTTDENNMGGLFVRKVGGAAALAFHSQKIAPLIFQPGSAIWGFGHFFPVLISSVIGNMAIVAFYAMYAEDLKGAGAGDMGAMICALLVVEALIMLGYALSSRKIESSIRNSDKRSKLPEGKTSKSVPSKIVLRTVAIVSGILSVVAIRDLFFPGYIMDFIPRDDIYLEWIGALIHSPPPGSVENEESGMEAPLYIGEKFVGQLMGLYILLTCIYKIISALLIRVGEDGSGETKSKLFWRVQAFGDGVITLIFRLFAGAATSASLDLRWHLMFLGYETFILFIYAFY